MGRLPALTGVRGIAALTVFVFHGWVIFGTRAATDPAALWEFTFKYGYLGVDLFFVLSAFLLARPFLKDPSRLLEKATWTSFVGRRLVRTAPAYYAAIALALALTGHWAYILDKPGAILLHLFYIPTADAATLGLINIAFWSLAVEFQFYVIMPLFLSLLLRRPWTVIGTTGVLAFAWPFLLMTMGVDGLYAAVQTPAYLFHFALGMGAAILEKRGWTPPVRSAILVPASLLLLVLLPNLIALPPLGLWHLVDERTAYTIWRAIPAMGFGVIVFLAATATGRARDVLESTPLLHFGKISFSLYLSHFPVLVLLPTLAPWTLSFGTTGFLVASFAICWPIAAIMYGLIEAPSLRWKTTFDLPNGDGTPTQYRLTKQPLLAEWNQTLTALDAPR